MERCVTRTNNKLLVNATGTFAFAGKKYCMLILPLFLGSHLSKVHSSHAKIILTWYCNPYITISDSFIPQITKSIHHIICSQSSFVGSCLQLSATWMTNSGLQVETLLSSLQLWTISLIRIKKSPFSQLRRARTRLILLQVTEILPEKG